MKREFMKRLFVLILIAVSPAFIYSQPELHFYQSNMVKVLDGNGKDLKNPFGGGLKFPVFTTLDLNFDNRPDLVILDRCDDRILTFINEGGKDTIKYSYRPEYEDLFPDTLNEYILLKDYNNDGKPDLFTYCSYMGGSIELLKNISYGNKILFERYYPDPTNTANPSLVGTYPNDTTMKSPIPILSSDIPGFVDADKDGDLDFFAFDFLGGVYLEYLKNFSVEAFGNADSLNFEMADNYWGYFMEADFSNKVLLGRTHFDPYKKYFVNLPGPKRHQGSTVFVNDMDGDGDLDLLLGDIGYPGIRLLENGKKQFNSKFDSIITQDTLFPASKPVFIHNMPTAFNIDVNNDGKDDYIFSPMDETLIDNKYVDGLNQVWYYKNTGTNIAPVLNFEKNNFLQEDMIDMGGSSSPALFDYDGDGDLDLFVATKGNNIDTKYLADRILLFKNTGTSSKPVFQKSMDDYLNLTNKGYKGLSVYFGDVDGDGNEDLIMGSANGHVIYYKNNPVNDSAVFSYVSDYFDSIDIGDYSVPVTADLDNDAKNELIIGSKKGRLSYWKNTGTTGNPKFILLADTFGKISIPGGDHYSAPVIADMDTNGHPDLVLSYNDYNQMAGLVTSKVVIYKDIDLTLHQSFKKTDTLFYNILTGKPVKKFIGRKLRPATADLDGDKLPDLLFGSDRGGLLFYGTNTSLSTKITVTGKTLLCQGDSAILDAGPGFDSYTWNTGAHTQQIVVKNAGSYECTVAKGSFSYKAYVSIQKHPGTIQANFSYTNDNLSVSFLLLNDNIDSVRWTFGDGSYSNDKNPVHKYANPGNYNVCVEIFDNCGASDTLCKANYFNGIGEFQNQQISVYPNPAENVVFIKSNTGLAGHKCILKVTDALGKEVIYRELTLRNEMILDIRTLEPGIYSVTFADLQAVVIKKLLLVKTVSVK
jgi:hypothetical protein